MRTTRSRCEEPERERLVARMREACAALSEWDRAHGRRTVGATPKDDDEPCPQGHSGPGVFYRGNRKKGRKCRICHGVNERAKRRALRQRAAMMHVTPSPTKTLAPREISVAI